MSAEIKISGGSDTKVRINSADPPREVNITGAGAVITNNPNSYDIVIAGTGTISGAANVGTGTGTIYRDVTLTNINLKSIATGSTKLSIANNANDITLDVVESNLTLANQIGTIGNAKISDLAYGKLTGVPSSFTPAAHKTTHQSGGTDSIPLDTLAATTDIVTLNASTTAHGLLRKLDNNALHFLDGTGAWTTPTSGSATPLAKGTASKNGDSSTKAFTIAHGMATLPVFADVIPTSIDALGNYVITMDATNITVTYQIAPPTGTGNLTYEWMAMDVNGGGGTGPPAGEANTYSTVGTGAAWTLTKSGINLPFRSFIAGSNKLTLTTNANDLTLDVAEANLTLSNLGGAVTTGQLPAAALTDTNTKTVSNKTIDSVTNTIPNLGSFAYTIFKSGSTYYCRNNLTGAILSSNANPDAVFQAALTAGGNVFVQAGTYIFSGGFAGLDFAVDPVHCTLVMDASAILTVPNGYTGYVFRIVNSASQHSSNNTITGGQLSEAGSVARNWEGIRLQGTGSTSKGTFHNTVSGVMINYPNIGIRFYVDSTGTAAFVNSNYIKGNIIYGAKTAFVDFDLVPTFTADVNGFYRNRFEYNLIQATNGTDATTGFRNIRHKDNLFIGNYVADLSGTQVSANIHTDAQSTVIIGGSLTSLNYTDASTALTTKIIDENKGIQTGKITPSNGTNLDIIPTGTSDTFSLWDSGQTKRMVLQKNSSDEVHFTSIKQTAGGALMPVVFEIQDVPGATLTESFRIHTDGISRFQSSKFAIRNPANTFQYLFVGSALAADRNITIPLLTAADTMALTDATQTFFNKTFNTDQNSLKDSGGVAIGDILVGNGSKFIKRLKGSANTLLGVNSGATDIAYATLVDANVSASAAIAHSKIGTNALFSETGLTGIRTFTLPDLTVQLTGLSDTATLTNKTVNASNNTINDTSIATGDILKSNGTKFVRFAMGTANQFLVTNAGGTDLAWATKSIYTEAKGTSTQSGNASTTVFTIAHGLAGTPTFATAIAQSTDADDDFYVTADGTNITITFPFAPPTATNNLVWWWRAAL